MKKPAKILTVFLLLLILSHPVYAARALVPGGRIIGMELGSDRLTVAALHDTLGENAKAAGLRPGDQLLTLNGKPVATTQDVRSALTDCPDPVKLTVLRSGKQKTLTLKPVETGDGKRLGVYLRSGVTGIGTVTYYDPESETFGALGHGVNNPQGTLLTLTEGTVYDAAIVSVRKGASGNPGQLMGTLSDPTPLGKLYKNTAQGVFGTARPETDQVLPIGKSSQIRTGAAVIRSTVGDGGIQEYSVEIVKIYPHSDCTGRNLLLRVTDPGLLETTGGIVQGMSGSPIIQDGKLVGAVTHVLVNDPTTGYGIFIENMLDAAA